MVGCRRLRFEILPAAFNALLLFGVATYILIEAYQRFRSPAEVHAMGMLWVAAFGLVINLISMRMLNSGKDASLNLKGAYLEVWSDRLGSIGVIGGALVIKYTEWLWVESLIAVAIGLWVLPRTWGAAERKPEHPAGGCAGRDRCARSREGNLRGHGCVERARFAHLVVDLRQVEFDCPSQGSSHRLSAGQL